MLLFEENCLNTIFELYDFVGLKKIEKKMKSQVKMDQFVSHLINQKNI